MTAKEWKAAASKILLERGWVPDKQVSVDGLERGDSVRAVTFRKSNHFIALSRYGWHHNEDDSPSGIGHNDGDYPSAEEAFDCGYVHRDGPIDIPFFEGYVNNMMYPSLEEYNNINPIIQGPSV